MHALLGEVEHEATNRSADLLRYADEGRVGTRPNEGSADYLVEDKFSFSVIQ